MQNYFNYYTEIEEHFQRRRGTLLMLSTLDWSLIAAWQEAGFPLQAVLAGIDATFEKYAARRHRAQRINGLAYCSQEVMRAVEDMQEAVTGAVTTQPKQQDSGFEALRIAGYLRQTAQHLGSVQIAAGGRRIFLEAAERLSDLAASLDRDSTKISMESLEQNLVALEDQLFAALQTFTPAEELLALREQSARELAPYRSRLQTMQIRQIEHQFLRRCLFEKSGVPRLSLFYMRQT